MDEFARIFYSDAVMDTLTVIAIPVAAFAALVLVGFVLL